MPRAPDTQQATSLPSLTIVRGTIPDDVEGHARVDDLPEEGIGAREGRGAPHVVGLQQDGLDFHRTPRTPWREAQQPLARPVGCGGVAHDLRRLDAGRGNQLLAQALQACNGNVSRAARQLGISRGRIYRHLNSGRPNPD